MTISDHIKRYEETGRHENKPNSPDLNLLDYSIWSILEQKACAKPHKTVESLKRALIKAWNEISVETLAKIVDDFPKRLKTASKQKEATSNSCYLFFCCYVSFSNKI